MAVVKKSKSLADEQIVEVAGNESPEKKNKVEESSAKTQEESKKTHKKGFLKTTIQELKKVDWPSFKYTVTWGGVVIIFTIIMSLALGTFDHVFKSGMNYVDCTANYKTEKDAADKDYKECAQDTIDSLVFKNK